MGKGDFTLASFCMTVKLLPK